MGLNYSLILRGRLEPRISYLAHGMLKSSTDESTSRPSKMKFIERLLRALWTPKFSASSLVGSHFSCGGSKKSFARPGLSADTECFLDRKFLLLWSHLFPFSTVRVSVWMAIVAGFAALRGPTTVPL